MTGRFLAGRYRLLEVIGQGGMAIVHRAHDELLDRDVAVKLLRPSYSGDPEFVTRFRREARHAASLHHHNVVTIHDLGTDPETDTDYIVMQLVGGPHLEAVLAREGRLSLGRALRIGIEAADALQAAHERGIVHRDVKPANILLDQDGEVRVADFGIARAVRDTGATTAGVFLGSPQYVSPEQVLGEATTPASDVYSLGVLLYEAMTGSRPFDGPSPAAVALERLRIQPAPPTAVAPDLPPEVDALILRAIARDPAERYASAAEFAIALERFGLIKLGGVRRTGVRARDSLAAVRAVVDPARRPRPAIASPAIASDAAARAAGSMETVAAPAPVDALNGPPGGSGRGTRPASRKADPARGERLRPERERRRRRAAGLPIALLLPLGALGLVVLIGINFLGGGRDPGTVASATGTSSLGGGGGLVVGPAASPRPTAATAFQTPATATPSSPLASSTLPPTPTPRSTPIPTARPTPTRAPTAAPTAPTRDPAETVVKFYGLVAAHRFEEAARLWSSRMRRNYPPEGNIDGRFASTTAIDINRVSIRSMSLNGKTASVFVDLTEYRGSFPSRRFVGTWDLILSSSGWLMDEPHF